MSKKIELGTTFFCELYEIFKFNSHSDLENKKARLFPNGNTNNEIQTTSIFLASLGAVKEFREELLLEIGIKKITTKNVAIHTYTELKLENNDRPDGLIVITSGKHNPIIEWVCFIESKVGKNPIDLVQIEKYIKFARTIGIKHILTISNNLASSPTQSPIKQALKSQSKGFNLYHWSWAYLKVTASRLIKSGVIEDEDHKYILSEFRRYFDFHKNVNNYTSMGKDWKDSVIKLHSYTKDQKFSADVVDNIVISFAQEEKDISLQLTDCSNLHIELLAEDDRLNKLTKMLNSQRTIESKFIINKDKKKLFTVKVDFIRQEISCCTDICIDNGKAKAQTTNLLKLLESDAGVTDSILITAWYNYKRHHQENFEYPISKLFDEKKHGNHYSILDSKYGDEVRYFEIKMKETLNRDFKSIKNFILKIEGISELFLKQVMLNLFKI